MSECHVRSVFDEIMVDGTVPLLPCWVGMEVPIPARLRLSLSVPGVGLRGDPVEITKKDTEPPEGPRSDTTTLYFRDSFLEPSSPHNRTCSSFVYVKDVRIFFRPPRRFRRVLSFPKFGKIFTR